MTADGGTRNHGESRNDDGSQVSGESQYEGGSQAGNESRDGSRDTATQQPAPAAGVLPNKAAEDDPRRWGDEPGGYDHDSWLEEQKPPHWG